MADKAVSRDSLKTDVEEEYKGKKLRIAFIGCGGISDTQIRELKKFQDVEVVAGCDIREHRLTHIKEKWGVKEGFTDWKEMLAKVKPEAVSICTPNALHAPAAIDASNAGCHVITEKPMAMNPKECEDMIAAAKKNKKLLCVGFQYRYHPHTSMLVRAREAGVFGNIMFMKCQALRRRGIPNWGVFGQKDKQGGGPMIDIGVHIIESAHFVMGRPKPVAAMGSTWTFMGNKQSDVMSMWPNWDYKTYTVEDLAIGQIRFENGAIMQIESSFVAHIEQNEQWNFSFTGDKGGGSHSPPKIFTDMAGTMVNVEPGYMTPDTGFDVMHNKKLRNFVDAVLHDKPLTCPGEDGLAVQKIIDGVYRSAAEKKEVSIA